MLQLVVAAVVLALAGVYALVVVFSHTPRRPVASELTYKTNGEDGEHELPSRLKVGDDVKKRQTLGISVVIPCYNETQRLGKMLDEAVEHLEARFPGDYEIILVDDGLSDGTASYALQKADELQLKAHTMKVVQLAQNRGKGGAVTHGLLHTSGELALFADADGATKFADVDNLIAYLKQERDHPAVAVGLRAHMVNTDVVVKRSFIRNFLMYGLHLLVYIFGVRAIQDTQCGFKMFNQGAIERIFPHMHTERWIFDVEVLLLAEMQGVHMKELAVNWEEVDGSKIDLAKDSIGMAIDLVVTRLAYLLGVYKIESATK